MDGKSKGKTLNPDIRKIRLSELGRFIQSEAFQSFLHAPITPSRARSYLENPHGKPEDIVLYLALNNEALIGFRSVFAGIVQTEKHPVRFGWCSGAWIHPGFRRRGISKNLLKEALDDWDNKLMLTNYAPEAEQLFISTGWFNPVHQFQGARAYLFPKTTKRLNVTKKRKILNPLLRMVDIFFTGLSEINCLAFRIKKNREIHFEENDFPDNQCFEFIQNRNKNYLFNPKEKELKWIFSFPWISDINREWERKYPFTACSKSFFYRSVKIKKNNKLAGIFIFSVREKHLKTLFYWGPDTLKYETARYLKQYCVKHKMEMITVYNNTIARYFLANKFPFLYIKKTGQKIYTSFAIPNARRFSIQDGAGDRVFT